MEQDYKKQRSVGGLRHIPEPKRKVVAERRLYKGSKGLGYLAAKDYFGQIEEAKK